MKFHFATLEDCRGATGLVIAIDVLRAFSTAAYAFSLGAEKIIPVSDPQAALQLKDRLSGALVIGEMGGLPYPGFDFGNSPTDLLAADLQGRTLVQRTGAGTQSLVRCTSAELLLAASFVVAAATVRYVASLSPAAVTFVITGWHGPDTGDEDQACADYLQARFNGQHPDPQPFLARVIASKDAQAHLDPQQPAFPASDLDYCTRLDAFDFCMPVTREHGQLVMRAVRA
jgi:2-phosphosulfolactate phosphatase